MISPAQYWRQSKTWSSYLGKRGVVLVSTFIRSADQAHQNMEPYSFALVKLKGGEKLELMGVGHEKLKPGDKIKCVLRKNPPNHQEGIIEYVIKVQKI